MTPMRTTLTLDDHLAAQLRELAHRQGVPFKHVVNRALSEGLRSLARPKPKRRARLPTYRLGVPRVPSLDRALDLAAALEDQEVARKFDLRK